MSGPTEAEVRAALGEALASLSGMHPEHARHHYLREEVGRMRQPEDVIDELVEDTYQERELDKLIDRDR